MCYCYFKQEQLALKPTLHLTKVILILFSLSWCHSLVEPSQWLCVEFIEDGWSQLHGGKNFSQQYDRDDNDDDDHDDIQDLDDHDDQDDHDDN